MSVGDLMIKGYSGEYKAKWNEFVVASKNGTFLFERDYMDYHADRFPDASLIAVDAEGAVIALLPATRRDDQLVSHAGLTYGGFVTNKRMTLELMLTLFDKSLRYLQEAGVTTLVYKPVPHIYHRSPAEEDLYALFLRGAQVYRRDVLSVLDYRAAADWKDRWRWRMRKAGKARRAGFEVRKTDDWDRFWSLLTSNLKERHGVGPVHSLEEIQTLAGRFPGQIELFGMCRGGEVDAGAVTYVTDNVCHAQYSASSERGRELRALDFVFAHIIDAFQDQVRYFDFGISNDHDGVLNEGLLAYKQRFGARAIVQDFYRLTLRDL